MAKNTHAVDLYDNAHFQQFDRVLMGDEMAHLLSRITMNWGKVEQALYISMKSLDANRADEWREAFFSTPVLDTKKKKALKSISATVGTSRPKLLAFFKDTLDELEDMQKRRNALSHGLWLPNETPNIYRVQPLRYEKGSTIFDPIIIVDFKFLGDLFEDMIKFTHRIFSIGSELLAFQQLKEWGKV